jgi:hypothetical protein
MRFYVILLSVAFLTVVFPVKKASTLLILEVKIINNLPVGWGTIFFAEVKAGHKDYSSEFNDTISFGITAGVKFDNLENGESYLISLRNSGEIYDKGYLPPVTGLTSKTNEIWLISEIRHIE